MSDSLHTTASTSGQQKSDATHISRICVLKSNQLDLLDDFASVNKETIAAIAAANDAAASSSSVNSNNNNSNTIVNASTGSTANNATTTTTTSTTNSTAASNANNNSTNSNNSLTKGDNSAINTAQSAANNASNAANNANDLVTSGNSSSNQSISIAFSFGKQRYVARHDTLIHAASSSSTSIDFAASFAYLHSVKPPHDELRILLQTKLVSNKKRAAAKPTYHTLAYAAVDLHELLQAPADGVVTLYKVIRPEKRSVRARLRTTQGGSGAAHASSAGSTVTGGGGSGASGAGGAGAGGAGGTGGGSSASGASSANAYVGDLELDDSDEERDPVWTDVDGMPVGRDTGNKRDTLGAPVARLHLRIATVAAGNERVDEFEDVAGQLDEGGMPVPLPSRDDVLPEAIGADDDDQMVAALSLADRIRYRVENQTKGGEKGPGKFRKWATKLRKRPTVDEKRQSKEPAAWVLSDDDSENADDVPAARSAPLAIHGDPLGSGGGGESPLDVFDNALSDDEDSVGLTRRATANNAYNSNDNDDNNDDDDGIGAVAAIARKDGKSRVESNPKRASKPLSTSKAPVALNLWKQSERYSLALMNIGRRSASVVAELWRSSPALADALPLMTYKDAGELMTLLAGAIDKRDELAQRVESTRPLSVMIVGDDKDVSDVTRPFLEIAAKKRRTWQPVEFWLVPIGKQRELANQIATHDATYRSLFFAADWLDFFQPATVRDASMFAAIAARIAQYAVEARATRSFHIGEALLTVDKAGGEASLQLTVPVLRQVAIGQRDSNESLPLRLDYWSTSEKRRDKEEKKEIKSFQFVAIQRLEAPQSDLLTLMAQKAGKKGGLARKMITGGRSDKDADALLLANVNKALVATASEKETFVVAIDDVEWPNVKFASIDPRWAGNIKQLAIQTFE